MDEAPADDTPRQQRAGDHSPSLQELDQLHGLAAIWYKLGLQLGVRADDLEIIEKNYPRDADTCKIKMFAKWKRGDINPTYEKLVGALTAAGKRKLAESVCSAQGISLSVLDGTDAMNMHQSHELETIAVEKGRPFGESRSPRTCTTGVLTSNSTVKSDRAEEAVIPSADKEEMESDAVAATRTKIRYLRNEYKQLVMMTQEAVKAKSPTLTEFRTNITLELPESIRSEVEPSLMEKHRFICEAKSFDDIFFIFNLGIWSYLNFGLLQYLVEIYGDANLQERIENYSTSVESFRKQTTLKMFWKADPNKRKCPEIPTELRKRLKRITFKHGNLDPTTTLNEIEKHRKALAEQYSFPEFTIILEDIDKGCVATTWLVPPSLAAKLAEETKIGNVGFLEQHNILELKIQDSTVYYSGAAQTTDGAISGHSQTEGSVPEISFSDLEFGEKLGEGASGVVYRGHWKSRDMDVAIKSLRVLGKINKTEIEILNKLRHPCIIQFHGVVVDRPGPPEHYIITELAEGGSLYDLLHKKKYQPSREESLRWAVQIAEGMKYLHQEQMMHRDLKSSNVLLTDEGNIKICDFGGAKHFDHTTKQTLTGIYRWMAPEVMRGEPVSLSVDVFSYGMLLYEILTGELPFADVKSDLVVSSKIMNEEVPPIPASVESYLAKTLKQCWNANAKDRPTFYNILEILANRDFDVTPPSRQALAQASPLLPLRVGHKRVQITDPAVHESTTKKARTLLATAGHLAITGYLVGVDRDILKKLGIALGIAPYRLQNTPSQSLPDCLVSLWLQRVDQVHERGGPTWHTLEQAMRHPTVGMTGKANDILKEQLKGTVGHNTGGSPSDSASPSPTYQENTATNASIHPFIQGKGSDEPAAAHYIRVSAPSSLLPEDRAVEQSGNVFDASATMILPVSSANTLEITPVGETQAAPAADGATSVPQISFSDLEFGDQLGEGAFAAVYRGHWKSGDMDVAIKRVPGKINKTEIEILNLKHPCIIQCHGVVVDSPGPPEHYIITELAEGGSLYDLLYKKNYHPSPEESLQWAREIAQGMKYLHQKKMLHRDLKSSNVLLTGEGNIKICDFGGAKYFDHTTKQTLIGTYRWMAPEVMMGEPVSLSSDVFSYGMLLYEIFTGKLPFTDAKTDMMAINKIISGEVPAIPASMESYLAKTLKQCWSANPKDRPSFHDILEILTKKVYDVTPPPSRQAMAQATPLLPPVVDRKRPQITHPADHKSPTRTPSEMNEAREQERRFTDQLDSLQTEITRLRLSGQKPQPTPLHPQAKITWEPCSDLPVKMHGAQTVVIKDKVYCGGGIAHDASDKLRVFCYSPAIDAWNTLPSCDMLYFGLSHWRGKLVTVGGIKSDGTVTNEVYEFDEATHTWKQSISPMPTARHSPAVLSHHSALTVAGGFTEDRTSVVEVFTEETSQWHTTEPLPFDWITPSTLLIDNRWYLLGGGAEQQIYSNQAVCIHIDLLLQKALPCDQASTESQGDGKAWETLPNTPVYGPAAATFGDSLLAVGGTTTNEMLQGVSAVYVYFPSPKAWIRISKLPVPLVGATTAMLSPTEPLVIGGWDSGSGSQCSVYKGLLRNE